ncbi:MAG: hypothetical protein LH629_06010 [Ignavibacteria bacterium]|nr:hypothetical protein [Ignavibacteria bacterium]
MKKYLVIDTELTALPDENLSFINGSNLITAYFGIIENDVLIDELDLRLIPDNGIFSVDPNSMSVNNIDLRNWDGIQYKDARKLVGQFIRRYVFNNRGHKIGDRLEPLGQSVSGDIQTIQNCLISKASWEESVERLPIDTLFLAKVLRDCGKLNLDSLSLQSLSNYFNVSGLIESNCLVEQLFETALANQESPHTARYDAITSYVVYQELQKLIKI